MGGNWKFDDFGGSLEFLAQKSRPNSLSCLAVVKAKLENRIGSAECSGLGNRNKAMWVTWCLLAWGVGELWGLSSCREQTGSPRAA